MSFLGAFNYSFVPSLSGFTQQVPLTPGFSANRFSYSTGDNNQNQIPIPQSIVPNPNSPTDYYGNPNELYNGNSGKGGSNQNSQEQQQSQPQLQQLQPGLSNPQESATFDDTQFFSQNANNVQQPDPQQFIPEQQQQQTQEFAQSQQQPNTVPQQRKRRPKTALRTRNAPAFIPQPLTTITDPNHIRVTPIQGPIFAKDGYVPVVPLYSYPSVNNGSLYQIPILWTALSYALGLEVRGEILRGLPCIKRLNQLFCPTAGTTYPKEHIERFIDENKALIKRMYGEFSMNSESYAGSVGSNSLRRSAREVFQEELPEYFGPNSRAQGNSTVRKTRQTVNTRNSGPQQQPKSNRLDSCESTVEIVTPYWAANSAGKVRAIVNTQHFEQAIHQEVCAKGQTKRCNGECACEQKYKWHRLLAYEPDNDCRGIFMDWFLFPSCCVCRCNP